MTSELTKIAEFYSKSAAPWPSTTVVSVKGGSIHLSVRSGDIETKTYLTTQAAEALAESLLKAIEGRTTRYAELNWSFRDGEDVPWPETDEADSDDGQEPETEQLKLL